MNKKHTNKDEFHYINPNYRNKIKDNLHTSNNPSYSKDSNTIDTINKKESQSSVKYNNNNEFAFRGNSELLDKYSYVPYYDKKNKN